METTRPLISCIIPTLNRATLLKEAIESTISQTYNNWELLIIDDGSTDHTKQVVNEYIKKDSRIKYFINDKKGQASARNFGLLRSHGQYIAFLDDDDISLPRRFESQLRASQKSGNRFIVSGYQVRDRKTGDLISENRLELKGAGAGFPSRWLISKDLLDQAGWFKENYPSMEEIELSYRISAFETFVLHDEIVAILYQTEKSVSQNKEKNLKGMVLMMDQLSSEMLPQEAGWWYYIIARNCYIQSKNNEAKDYFKLAFQLDKRINFRVINYYYMITKYFTKINFIRKINYKIFSILGKYKFPRLVNHSIVS